MILGAINKLTLKLESAGTLDNALRKFNRYKINHLELVGDINYYDIRTIRQLASSQYCQVYNNKLYGSLSILDLSKVSIIRGGYFYLNSKPSYYYYLSKDNVIDYQMFSECDLLSKIILPNSITMIGYEAFRECTNIESIVLPNSIIQIEPYAFASCKGLKSIVLPEKITMIKHHMFENCIKLESIQLPNSITSIDAFAFDGCTNLAFIRFPDHIVDVDVKVFRGCDSLNLEEISKYTRDNTEAIECLHDSIRNSVRNNIHSQEKEVLAAVNAAIESDIEPVGKTLEEKKESYKSQLISKVRENLSVMPRKVFVNSQGIASITPTYYLDNDLQVRPDIATEESMSDFITKEELLKKTPIASVMLKPEDIKFNESDGTFSIKVNRITYTFEYDGEYKLRKISESEDPVVNDVAKEFEKYSGILTKGIEDVIKEGSKQVDVTKMSPKERIAYNKSAKLASFFNSLTSQQLSDILNQGFAAPESSYLDLIEQVTGALDITPEMKSADNLLSALRTNYTTNKDGKSNC